jgi:hypothetical protein
MYIGGVTLKKQTMVKMYNFTQQDLNYEQTDCIQIKNYDEDTLKLKEARTGYNILLDAYIKYNYGTDKQLEKDMIFDSIFKLALPEDEEAALKLCKDGVVFNGKKYIGYFATPSMMKYEESEEDGKCQMLFIQDDKKDFRDFFENLITLGKIDNLYDKNIKICKDFLSRISLATSTSFKLNYIPKIIIVDEIEFTYTANYITPKIVDGDIELQKLPDHPKAHVMSDGGGIMSLKMADSIGEQLGLDYKVDYCIFRYYAGLAMKGGLTRVDFNDFFSTYYTEDTPYFRRKNGQSEIKNVYGEWQTVADADMIVNTSCAKWYKHFLDKKDGSIFGMEEVNKLISEVEEPYKDLISNIFITKVNKVECKKMTRANYQLIGNLALTPNQIAELSKYTEDMYKRILDNDIDTLKLFLNDIVKQEAEGKIEELVPSTKMKALLDMNEDFIKLGTIQRDKARLINKKIGELCGSKFYIHADWKYMVADPITLMFWLLKRTDDTIKYADFSLKENEFYIPRLADKEYVLERCPLNCYTELRKVKTCKNDIYDKYLGDLTQEIIIFNQVDNKVLDGDYDGDFCLCVDEPTIYNAVVEPEDNYQFINLDDDKSTSGEMKFEKDYTNRYTATIRASGNEITRLANWGSVVTDISTELGYIGQKSNNYYTYSDIKQKIKDDPKFIKLYKDAKKISNKKERSARYMELGLKVIQKIDELVETGKLIPEWVKYSEEELKEEIIKGFYDKTKYGYYLLRLQQLGIDRAKTLKSIPEEEMELIKDVMKDCKKPRFMKYLKRDVKNINTEIRKNAINMNASRIAGTLYKEDIEESNKPDNKAKMLYPYMTYEVVDEELFERSKKELRLIYDNHNEEHNTIHFTKYEDSEVKSAEFKKLDSKTTLAIKELEEKYGFRYIAFACVREKISENFTIAYCWNSLYAALKDKVKKDTTAFIQDEEGKYEYLGKKYRKEITKYNMNENLQYEQQVRAYKRLGEGFKKEIRIGVKNISLLKENAKVEVKPRPKGDGTQNIELYVDNRNLGFVFYDAKNTQITDTLNIKDLKDFSIYSIANISAKQTSATIFITD